MTKAARSVGVGDGREASKEHGAVACSWRARRGG